MSRAEHVDARVYYIQNLNTLAITCLHSRADATASIRMQIRAGHVRLKENVKLLHFLLSFSLGLGYIGLVRSSLDYLDFYLARIHCPLQDSSVFLKSFYMLYYARLGETYTIFRYISLSSIDR